MQAVSFCKYGSPIPTTALCLSTGRTSDTQAVLDNLLGKGGDSSGMKPKLQFAFLHNYSIDVRGPLQVLPGLEAGVRPG